MRRKSPLFDRYEQAVELYHSSCLKAGIRPFRIEKSLTKFMLEEIRLKDEKDNIIRVQCKKRFLRLKLNGIDYYSKIEKKPQPPFSLPGYPPELFSKNLFKPKTK